MKYTQPLNEAANSSYVNGNAEQGTQGSIIPANAIEDPQREMQNVIQQAYNQSLSTPAHTATGTPAVPVDTDLAQLYQAIRQLACPAGQIMAWGGSISNVPHGFLACTGQAINRVDYADLYAVLGTTHGIGDGSTSFNLPDLQDRFIIGRSSDKEVAATGGSFSHTLTIDEMPSHNHFLVGGSPFGSSADLNTTNDTIAEHGRRGGAGDYDLASAGRKQPSRGKSSSTGGGGAHDVTNPYYSLIYMIRS